MISFKRTFEVKCKMKLLNKIVRSMLVITIVIAAATSASSFESNYENTNINKTVNLSTMAMKIVENEEERLYTPLSTLSGELTGYVYNCPLCTGRLACMSSLDLSNGTTTYNDETYGDVKIVASSKNLPCGTILSITSSRISSEATTAIVLDRGVLGNDLDLLVDTMETALTTVGRSNITYNVLRSGW